MTALLLCIAQPCISGPGARRRASPALALFLPSFLIILCARRATSAQISCRTNAKQSFVRNPNKKTNKKICALTPRDSGQTALRQYNVKPARQPCTRACSTSGRALSQPSQWFGASRCNTELPLYEVCFWLGLSSRSHFIIHGIVSAGDGCGSAIHTGCRDSCQPLMQLKNVYLQPLDNHI